MGSFSPGIGKGLLNGEGKQMDDEVSEWAKESDRGKRILDELKDLDFYVEKEAKKREIEKCYSWEEFMTWRETLRASSQAFGCTLCRWQLQSCFW